MAGLNFGARCNAVLAPLNGPLQRTRLTLQSTRLLAVVLFARSNANISTCTRSVAGLKSLSAVEMNTKRH
jgi:hypothetical protein